MRHNILLQNSGKSNINAKYCNHCCCFICHNFAISVVVVQLTPSLAPSGTWWLMLTLFIIWFFWFFLFLPHWWWLLLTALIVTFGFMPSALSNDVSMLHHHHDDDYDDCWIWVILAHYEHDDFETLPSTGLTWTRNTEHWTKPPQWWNTQSQSEHFQWWLWGFWSVLILGGSGGRRTGF